VNFNLGVIIYFSNIVFFIKYVSLALVVIYCRYKSTIAKLITNADITLQSQWLFFLLWNSVNLMFIGPCIIVIAEEWKTNLMLLAILFHLLCAQNVSDINISIIRSLRLCWITTSVALFSVRCAFGALVWLVLGGVRFSGCSLRTENKTTDVVIHQHSYKLLMMDILMSETCWAHKKWNKIASDIEMGFVVLASENAWILSKMKWMIV